MNNHLDREEVREALASGTGSSIRYSDTLKERMMYVAIKVNAGEGSAGTGIVRLAMSLGDVERSLDNMWLALIFGLLLLFVVAGAVSYRVALGVTRPLERMTSAAKRMANMDYATRVPDGGKLAGSAR
jgi:two-component system phosphate regulon sensor histidine kinase PhoR